MVRIKSKLAVALIAVAAIVLIAGVGAYAYWSAQQSVPGNSLTSGHMGIALTDVAGGAVVPMNVAGIMPGDNNGATPAEIRVINSNSFTTDLVFKVSNVADTYTLSDNVQLAFLLCTGGTYNYWLTPTGTVNYVADSEWESQLYDMSAFNGKIWEELPGYVDISGGAFRTVKVYYKLPLDCDSDCHDDTATFDMIFELVQSH